MYHKNGKRIVAVDFETTGINHNDSAPLTLGLAWKNQDHEYRTDHIELNIFDHFYHTWSPEAAIVNNIDFFTKHNLPTDTVGANVPNVQDRTDWYIFNNLLHLASWTHELIPVGWNVNGFDMRFMLHYFPKSAEMFYYSSLGELNTMCSVMDSVIGRKTGQTKKLVKTRATHKIEADHADIHKQGAHNAEYDALHSLMCYEQLDEEFSRLSLELNLR